MKGIITTIQRMSLHDGPGIRSTIFFKGCNFKCVWCHNPETYSMQPELEFIKQKCIVCEECLKVDKNTPMAKVNDSMTFTKENFSECQKYSNICYSGALHTIGKEVTVEEVYQQVKSDIPYFRNSGGGITLSGGEPLLQPEFCKELLKIFDKHYVHTAIETNLSLPWKYYEAILPYLGLIFVDLKSMNSRIHESWTGKSNKSVLDNIKKLEKTGKLFIIRTPIIPNFNNSKDSVIEICNFLKNLKNLKCLELLPYHPLADSKFENLGIKNPMQGVPAVTENEIDKLYEIINEYRIPTNRN